MSKSGRAISKTTPSHADHGKQLHTPKPGVPVSWYTTTTPQYTQPKSVLRCVGLIADHEPSHHLQRLETNSARRPTETPKTASTRREAGKPTSQPRNELPSTQADRRRALRASASADTTKHIRKRRDMGPTYPHRHVDFVELIAG